jgi:hypothetical protein
MSITVEALFDSRQLVTDGKIKSSEMDFLVSAASGETLVPEDALYAQGVPKVLFQNDAIVADTYPYDPELRVDSKNVKQRINENTYIINVKYSNNNRFSFGTREMTQSVTFNTSLEELSLPFCTLDNIVYPPVPTGGVPAPVTRWQTREFKVKTVNIDLRLTCQFDNIQANIHVDAIANQIGNWHKLGQRNANGEDPADYWRFLGGNANSIELVTSASGQVWRYNLEYTWRQRRTLVLNDQMFKNGYPSNLIVFPPTTITQFDTVAVRPPSSVDNPSVNKPLIYTITTKPNPRNTTEENSYYDLPAFPWRR